jgi:hypothetical protein
VAIFNPLGHTISFYINGVLGGIRNDVTIQLTSVADVLNYIGKSVYTGDAYLTGSVDEFRVYNGVLTPDKIALNAAAGPNTFVSTPGTLQSLRMEAQAEMVLDGIQRPALFANFANVSNVNLSSFGGVTFSSSNPNVLIVDETGLVAAVGEGIAEVVGSYSGMQITQEVSVIQLPLLARHRYSFNEFAGAATAEDSISGAAGTLVGGAGFDDLGSIVFDGTNGFVDLPNGIISSLSNATFEAWVTPVTGRTWERLFDFGVSSAGEGNSGTGDSYLFLVPRGGAGPRFTIKPSGGGESPVLEPTGHLPLGAESHLAVVYSASGGVARLYVNGVLRASGPVTIPLSAINDVNNWLGRSQFAPDDYFAGKISEFRIYSAPLTGPELKTSKQMGENTTYLKKP